MGAAANHSLLYVLARLLRGFRFASILELGVGQTTILLDRLIARLGVDTLLTSVAHDPEWAKIVGARTGRPVALSPLVPGHCYGVAFSGYATLPAIERPLDLVIIDGPPANDPRRCYSRLGCVDLVLPRLAGEFVIMVDDAARVGELHLVNVLRRCLGQEGHRLHESVVRADKCQHLLCTPTFRAAAAF